MAGPLRCELREARLTDGVLAALIGLSQEWAAERSCTGYRANERADIEGRRVFVAEDGAIVGYLFGSLCRAERMTSVMPEGTPYFEVEELYVRPEYRRRGIGAALFHLLEDAVKGEAGYIVLSTATKNWRAILHFYIDELDMAFWSARLFKKI